MRRGLSVVDLQFTLGDTALRHLGLRLWVGSVVYDLGLYDLQESRHLDPV